MNKSILMGRLVSDPEIRTTSSQIAVCTFKMAVDRKFKDANGDKQADFIPCVAWRQQAEFIAKYFKKGSKIIVSGSIQTRSYDDKDGHKRNITEVIVDDVEFAESKQAEVKPQINDSTFDDPIPFDI